MLMAEQAAVAISERDSKGLSIRMMADVTFLGAVCRSAPSTLPAHSSAGSVPTMRQRPTDSAIANRDKTSSLACKSWHYRGTTTSQSPEATNINLLILLVPAEGLEPPTY